jgi:hypothetical protein
MLETDVHDRQLGMSPEVLFLQTRKYILYVLSRVSDRRRVLD